MKNIAALWPGFKSQLCYSATWPQESHLTSLCSILYVRLIILGTYSMQLLWGLIDLIHLKNLRLALLNIQKVRILLLFYWFGCWTCRVSTLLVDWGIFCCRYVVNRLPSNPLLGISAGKKGFQILATSEAFVFSGSCS